MSKRTGPSRALGRQIVKVTVASRAFRDSIMQVQMPADAIIALDKLMVAIRVLQNLNPHDQTKEKDTS